MPPDRGARLACSSVACMVVFALVWRHAQTCVPRLGPRERSEYDECSGEDCGLAPTASTLRAIDRSVSDRTPPETRAQPSLTSPPASTSFGGHEWIGGAVGRAERFGNRQRRHASARAPHNSTLLLLGVVSGCKNFDVRNWVRRALWQQRAWRYGVEWRFVVGSTLPRGDNDRVSLHYEAARHGDIDIVRGSELPPRQGRIAVRWWLHAAALVAARAPASAPAFVGILRYR